MTTKQLETTISNMKEIIRVSPNTYAAYVAQTTLNVLEAA